MDSAALPASPDFRLDSRHALVTGAGRGIGSACAVALARAGAQVTLVARSGAEVEAVAAELRKHGAAAGAVALDITDNEAVAGLVAAAPSAFDILVNNAGTNRPGPFAEATADDYDLVMGLNVRALFFTAQAVVRRLLDEGRTGSIINMSSQMGLVGGVNRSIYCASKHAVEGLTKAMAVELGPKGIRVNSICPTFIETPMTKPYFADADFRQAVVSKIRLGRLGTVEDIMGAVVFLASDASALMTGSSLVVDGGWTAE